MNKKITELEFASQFLKNVDKFAYFNGFPVVVQELSTAANGIPDAILLSNESERSLLDFANAYPDLNITNAHASVTSKLHRNRNMSVETLQAKTNLSTAYLNKIISDLEKYNAITVTADSGKKQIRLKDNFALPNVKMVSIEFKLDNWKSALRQALRYLAFSEVSIVVMPENKNKTLKNYSDLFKNFGIGLVTYNQKTEEVKVVVKPKNFSVGAQTSYTDAVGRIISTQKA